MATVSESRLFPPIVSPYLPAKNITSVSNGIEIPFEINELNSLEDIKEIHVLIVRQSSYNYLFKTDNYPLGIYIMSATSAILEQHKLTIPSSIINPDQLGFNEYYKMQLRFSSDDEGVGKTGATLSSYLLNEAKMAMFSEWSSVGLIRFIADPTISMMGNIQGDTHEMEPGGLNVYQLTSHYLNLSGRFYKQGTVTVLNRSFDKSTDNEYLSDWRIEIQDENDNVLIDSGIQKVNIRGAKMNEIQYNVPFYFENNVTYKVVLYITTANLYENSYTYQVTTNQTDNNWGSQTDINEYTSLDSVIGKVNISFEAPSGTTTPAGGKLVVRRSSEYDNFLYWETIWQYDSIPALGEHDVISYDDFTIESGTIYKYAISYTDGNDDTYSIIEGPILSVFDHAFLTGEGTQLCVRFNPNINSFKINVSDNTVTTIGGKHPYITRNGNMYYRTFSLSGTIAYEMDAEHQFATRSSIYGDWINVYGSYFVNRYINERNDRITQRKFRELVMAYFYDDTPKLFRSTPEGNILVRITDVNLTPKQELARMIYDFSCTAIEIGDASIENYKLYNIQDFGDA